MAFDAHAQSVTFRYQHNKTRQQRLRTLPLVEFLWRLMIHVLPSGYRRVRDYGFLHGNAKASLTLVNWVLRIMTTACTPGARPQFKCPACQAPMQILAFIKPAWRAG